VFVNIQKTPFIYLETDDGITIFNVNNSDETQAIFQEILRQENTRRPQNNDAFLQIVGRTRYSVVGKEVSVCGFWLNPGEREETLKHLSKESSISNKEITFKKESGEIRDGCSRLILLKLTLSSVSLPV
jgi:hypothetical protein